MERWDIYDAQKCPTGRTMGRNEWILREGEYHLTVLGVIKRTDGRFLITRRALDKSWAPGSWEVPGGAVQAGEASRTAINREILEETGLDVSGCFGKLALTYERVNLDEGDNYFVDCYLFVLDFSREDVCILKEETIDFRLATLAEIRELARKGLFLHYDSIKQVFSS